MRRKSEGPQALLRRNILIAFKAAALLYSQWAGDPSENDRQRKYLVMTDFASVQKHLAAITTAQTDFAKSSFEANKAYFEKLAGVKSPDKFVELTTEYAKSAQETFVAEATKIGELYKAFAQEAFKPITSSFSPK